MLSPQADFRTKECKLLMAHKLRLFTEVQNAQISFCDDRNWFASVCIKHGVFQSRRSKTVTVAPHRLSTINININTTKETIFLIVAQFRGLIPAVMST